MGERERERGEKNMRQHNMSTDTVHKSTTDTQMLTHPSIQKCNLVWRTELDLEGSYLVWPGVKPC